MRKTKQNQICEIGLILPISAPVLQTLNLRHLNHWFLHSETVICELNLFCKRKLKSIFIDKVKKNNKKGCSTLNPPWNLGLWFLEFTIKSLHLLITSLKRLDIFRIQFSVRPKIFSCVARQMWKFEKLGKIMSKGLAYERSQGCGFGWRHRLLSPYRELFVFCF